MRADESRNGSRFGRRHPRTGGRPWRVALGLPQGISPLERVRPPPHTATPCAPTPLAVIVIAQLFGTSLWFSANSAGDDLMRAWALQAADIGRLTIAVQLGFILGTLGFALSGLADRFAASRIFAVCAVLGAAANAGFALLAHGLGEGLAWRFVVGLALAGVYPLGMKLVVSWVPQHAGAALAWLVGMLTLGTALPHGVRALDVGWGWQATLLVSSVLALLAAVMIFRSATGRISPAAPARRGCAWAKACMRCAIRASAPRPSVTSATSGSCTRSGRWCRCW